MITVADVLRAIERVCIIFDQAEPSDLVIFGQTAKMFHERKDDLGDDEVIELCVSPDLFDYIITDVGATEDPEPHIPDLSVSYDYRIAIDPPVTLREALQQKPKMVTVRFICIIDSSRTPESERVAGYHLQTMESIADMHD